MSRSLADSCPRRFGEHYRTINRVLLHAPGVNIPYQHTAVGMLYPGDKAKYYGVTDPITGEGITTETGPGGGAKSAILSHLGQTPVVTPPNSDIEVVGYEYP